MRAIVLIGINFVRTQWIALAVMCAYVLGIGGIYRIHTQRDEILFFLRWHAGYAIFFATMIAIPALADRAQNAPHSRGAFQRHSSLAISWRPVVRLRHDFCFVLFADRRNRSMAGPAGQNSHWMDCGDYAAACFVAASLRFPLGLFFATFFHPLLATAATSAVLALPLIFLQFGLPVVWAFFPAGALFRTLWTSFQFRSMGNSLNTLIVSAISSGSAFLDCRRSGLCPPRRDYFSGVVATGSGEG